uniref:uncharacterized protein LOC120336221 isoform X1 n=2 Tax=Styela clava TaxID=7725 RepID=UPI00193ACA99|nr:uncharacterized protein LOC120336221 isoform X1 [Styela clava]
MNSISYDLDELVEEVAKNMEVDNNNGIELQFTTEGEQKEVNITLTFFRILVCVFGILGNILVIFVILVLSEYRKAVTHWYVLQLAIADSIFLLTIPFRISEDIENTWIFPEWMCKAKETILFLNYYSSIAFLVVMSIDRYIAVCHGFSSFLQKFRTPLAAAIITVAVWTVCFLICIPIMLYSTPRGHMPNCKCEYQFPKYVDANKTCADEGEVPGTDGFDSCVAHFGDMSGPACANLSLTSMILGPGSGSGAFGFDYSEIDLNDFDPFASEETTASPTGETDEEKQVFLQPGCHYFDYADGFKAFIWFNFVVMFLIPLLIMTVCYALIVRRLYGTKFRSGSTSGAPNSSTSGNGEKGSFSGGSKRKRTRSAASAKNSRNKIRVTVMCASMVILFFICWLPFHSVHLAKMKGIPQKQKFCQDLFYAVSLIAFANSAINPYLYNFIGTRFGKRLRRVRETKTAKMFLSIATGKSRAAGKHSSVSGADIRSESATKRSSTKGKNNDSKNNRYNSWEREKEKEAREELLRNYPVYTGPTTAQPQLPLENLSKSDPPQYQEQSHTTTQNEQMKTEPLTAKLEQ